MKRACENCKFCLIKDVPTSYHERTHGKDTKDFHCHRYAPRPPDIASWPRVSRHTWCGEWSKTNDPK